MEREQAGRSADEYLRLVGGTPARGSFRVDPALRSQLSDEWELDAVPFPASFSEDPAARPVAVLVGSAGFVVHAHVLGKAPAEPEELARVLASEVDAAIDSVQRAPRRIDVRHASVADTLRPLLQPRGIAVRSVRNLTSLRDAVEGLTAHLAGRERAPMASMPETWAGWDLPRDYIARLFRAAAAYYRARPWQLVADDRPIVATLADGAQWRAVILGNAGQEFGLALYSDRDDLAELYRGRDPEHALHGLRGEILSVTFAAKDDLPPRMRREVRDAGWEIAGPAAHPLLIVMGTPGGGVRRSQVDQMIALLGSVPRFVAALQHDLSRRREPAARWTDDQTGAVLSFDTSGELSLEAFWDQPEHLTLCGPEGLGAKPDVRLQDVSDEEREALMRQTVDRFAQHCQTDGLFAAVSAATAKKHASTVWLFLHFLTGYQGIAPSAVTEFDLREFLYSWYPRKVMASEQEARSLLGSLRRFFVFLAEVDGIDCPWAGAILGDRDAFLAMWYGSREPDTRGTGDWLAPFTADLEYRALLPANDAVAIEWGGLMGRDESTLFDEVQRLWLRWRDEIIRAGPSERDAVYAALRERQRAWAKMPNALVGGETPVRAVERERERLKSHRV